MARSHACDLCGAPASVHVMHEIGRPGSARHFCMVCADRYDRSDRFEAPLRRGALLIAGGLCLLTACLACDLLPIGRARGPHGWQFAGVVFGLIIFAVGTVTRSSSLMGPGLVLLLFALAHDGFGTAARWMGAGQAAGLAVACAMVVTGLAIGRLSRRRDPADFGGTGYGEGPARPHDRQEKGDSIHA